MQNRYKFKLGDLDLLIPYDVLKEKLISGDSEIEPGMLCFEENYIPIANNVPKDFVIVDAGCYMAAQAYLFTKHKKYVGVDFYDSLFFKNNSAISSWYKPPERFQTENSEMLCMTIREFIDQELFNYDLDYTYFVCSAVPAFKETDELFDKVKNCAVFYPGERKQS